MPHRGVARRPRRSSGLPRPRHPDGRARAAGVDVDRVHDPAHDLHAVRGRGGRTRATRPRRARAAPRARRRSSSPPRAGPARRRRRGGSTLPAASEVASTMSSTTVPFMPAAFSASRTSLRIAASSVAMAWRRRRRPDALTSTCRATAATSSSTLRRAVMRSTMPSSQRSRSGSVPIGLAQALEAVADRQVAVLDQAVGEQEQRAARRQRDPAALEGRVGDDADGQPERVLEEARGTVGRNEQRRRMAGARVLELAGARGRRPRRRPWPACPGPSARSARRGARAPTQGRGPRPGRRAGHGAAGPSSPPRGCRGRRRRRPRRRPCRRAARRRRTSRRRPRGPSPPAL